MTTDPIRERKLAVMQLKQGVSIDKVAQNLGRHPNWVRKWQKRFDQSGWRGLQDQSRAPKQSWHKLPEAVRQAIIQARLELEAAAELGEGLKYIGGLAVRTRLKADAVTPLPSVPTIERVLRKAQLTRLRTKAQPPEIEYPRLQPTVAQQLCQVDIMPHFLQGGRRVACFNALDVVSRYPTGRAFDQRRAQDAAEFLVQVWQEIGIPQYTQVDNEGCFSGGATHPYVLGQVLRLALEVGTELLFSPVRHPQSNCFVERFHQDYQRHVWQDTYLSDLTAVNERADHFFALYRQRQDHGRLDGQSPTALHKQTQVRRLAADFTPTSGKRPLRPGRVHFMRRVQPDGTVRVLNAHWTVPRFDLNKGVWVTLALTVAGATLSIYDAAPDQAKRRCLAKHPFPLSESVVLHENEPLVAVDVTPGPSPTQPRPTVPLSLPPLPSRNQPGLTTRHATVGQRLSTSTLNKTSRLTHGPFYTMF